MAENTEKEKDMIPSKFSLYPGGNAVFVTCSYLCIFKGPSGLEMKQDKKHSQEGSEEVVYLMDPGEMGV